MFIGLLIVIILPAAYQGGGKQPVATPGMAV